MGEFTQCQGRLHNGLGYCCLGVLCQLSGLGKWDRYTEYRCAVGHDENYLPDDVQEWAGLGKNPQVYREHGIIINLGNMNDTGSTFEEIADLIEKYF